MFGLTKHDKTAQQPEQPARLDSGTLGGPAQALAERLLGVGIGGRPPFDSASKVADQALKKTGGDVDKAIDRIVSDHRRLAGAEGFITSVGGLVTMAVSLPANVAGFYLLSTRMVAAIAKVRGHDLDNPSLRTAILLTLVGAEANDLLKKAGVASTGRLASLATRQLPPPVLMVVNKAVGFRLVGQVGEKVVTRLGKAIPLVGGFVGAGLDAYLISKIAANAKQQFPAAGRAITA